MKNTTDKVTLYIATHNITGKKYFGKTTRYFTEEDLQKYYHGSGKYWNNHIKKHGDDVTMEIYGIYNIDDVEEVALKFSKENSIVEDYDTWTNQKEENGLDGGFEKHTDEIKNKISNVTKGIMNPFYGKKHTEESLLKISKASKGRICSQITRDKLSKKQKGIKKHSEEYIVELSESRIKEGNPMYNKKHSEESKKLMSEKQKGKNIWSKGRKFKQNKLICPHCGKEGGASGMKKWHFDNCKLKG